MKSRAFVAVILAISSSTFGAETNWIRLGQVDRFIVDVDKASITNINGGRINVVTRLLPRASEPDTKEVNPKATIHGQKPIFFTLIQADYQCKPKVVLNIKETSFDTNANIVGDSSKSEFSTIPAEHLLVMEYLCKE